MADESERELTEAGEYFLSNPDRTPDRTDNDAQLISTTFFRKAIILYCLTDGRRIYVPSEFYDWYRAFQTLTLDDEEKMRTRNWPKWQHRVDAAKQGLRKRGELEEHPKPPAYLLHVGRVKPHRINPNHVNHCLNKYRHYIRSID